MYPQSMRFVGDYSESIRIEGYCAYLELYGRCSMPQIDYSQTGADLSGPAVNDAPRHGHGDPIERCIPANGTIKSI
jgi:hypothetical protein